MKCIINETGSTDTLQKYWIAHEEQGCWEGRNEEEVMELIAKNAGYATTAEMNAVVGKNNITLEQISKAEYEEIDTIISELGIGQGEALRYIRESFNNPIAENMDCLAGLMPGKGAGSEWMNFVLVNTDDPEEWYSLDYQEFLQAAANANRPPFPAFETAEETDAAYEAAWDELQRCKQLDVQDKIYQEDLEKRKEGWKDYDGK